MAIAKGYAATDASKPLTPFTFERREPNDDDVVISIKYSGVCHSDIHQARGEWGNSTFPMVPGHEIAGVVTSVGSKVTKFKVGDHVGVGCFVNSCVGCATRDLDNEQYLPGLVQTYNDFEADGKTPTYGGYSDSIVVKEGYVLSIPDNLPLDAAAPLLCAGITLYSPLRHWNAGPGKKVAIVGMGGLGHMGVKLGARDGRRHHRSEPDAFEEGRRPEARRQGILCDQRRGDLHEARRHFRPDHLHRRHSDRLECLSQSPEGQRLDGAAGRSGTCRTGARLLAHSAAARAFPVR